MLAAGDIPPLRIVVSRLFGHIVAHPAGQVVIPGFEQPRDVILSAHHIQQQPADVGFRLCEQVAVMLVQVDDLANLTAHQFMERAGLQQGVPDVGDTRRGQAHAQVV